MVRSGCPSLTVSPSATWTSLTVPRRGTKTFAVPFVGVRYPTAVSLRAYCATKRKPIRSATTAATNPGRDLQRQRLERSDVAPLPVMPLEVDRLLPEQLT